MSRLVVLCGFRGGRSNDRLERTGPAGVSILRGEMSLLRRRDFLLIFGAFALSALGDYVALITLTLRVQETTGSGWAVAALLGVGLAVTQPALFALLPRAVGEDRTTQANAFLEVARWGGAAAGPVLAAVLSQAFGAGSTLLANAGTFVAVAVLVSMLRVRRRPEPQPEGAPAPRGQAREGLVFIAREPLLRLVVPMVGLMVVFAAADNVAEVFFAKDVLSAGDTGYGVLVTTWTIGMVMGSTAAGRFLTPAQLAPAVVILPIIGGAAVVVAATGAIYPLAVAMFLVGGFANGVELVGMRSLLHRRVPDRLRGRAFSLYFGMVQAAQIVALGVSGGLVEAAGARMTMVIAGAGTAAVGVVGTFLFARIPSGERRTTEPASVPPWVPA